MKMKSTFGKPNVLFLFSVFHGIVIPVGVFFRKIFCHAEADFFITADGIGIKAVYTQGKRYQSHFFKGDTGKFLQEDFAAAFVLGIFGENQTADTACFFFFVDIADFSCADGRVIFTDDLKMHTVFFCLFSHLFFCQGIGIGDESCPLNEIGGTSFFVPADDFRIVFFCCRSDCKHGISLLTVFFCKYFC